MLCRLRDGETDASGVGRNVSVILGDMLFSRSSGADYQKQAFLAGAQDMMALLESKEDQLVRALFMVDQVGPWSSLFPNLSRKARKRTAKLSNLAQPYQDDLCDFGESVGVKRSDLKSIVEVHPEEKLKFIFSKLASLRRLSIETLLQRSFLEDKNEGPHSTDCSESPLEDAGFETVSQDFSDYLVKCRGVAGGLFARAACLLSEELPQPNEIRAHFQIDPSIPNRVRVEVVNDAAVFLQGDCGYDGVIHNYFYLPNSPSPISCWTVSGGMVKKG